MIELRKDDDGRCSPMITCDVCFEPITDCRRSDALWSEDLIDVVFIVHHHECRRFGVKLCGMFNVRIMNLQTYLQRVLKSVGFFLSISMVSPITLMLYSWKYMDNMIFLGV